MIVLCPKCKTKYRVDETKVGPQGVKLRCSQCQTIFKVAMKAPAQAPVAAPRPEAPPAPAPKAAVAPPPAPAQPAPAPAPGITAPPPPPPAISGPIMPKTAAKAELLLADADESFLNKIGDELTDAGYMVWYARDGESAFKFIKERKPQVAIIEVLLPGLFGFEVCEKVKADKELSNSVKLVLVGSVFEKNRFRRAPTTLYGADAYVDKYHNGKQVLKKVEVLLGFAKEESLAPSEEETQVSPAPVATAPAPSPKPEPAPQAVPTPRPVQPSPPHPATPTPSAPMPPQPRPVASPPSTPKPVPSAPPKVVAPPPPPRPVPPPAPKPVAPPPPPPEPVKAVPSPDVAPAKPVVGVDWAKAVPASPEHQKAARLARTIVADIALYNPDLVERGVREGNLAQLLQKDLEDGKKHFESKVGPEIMAVADYFQMALDDLIAKKRKKLGLD